jgi:5-methylcytosine-specific restriction endonuclease McrA
MSIRLTKDHRTIRTGKDYTAFRYEIYQRQGAQCAKCPRYTSLGMEPEYDSSFHVHHRNGRGMGGSKRNDSCEDCIGLCGSCHRQEHNQQSAVPSELKWSRA